MCGKINRIISGHSSNDNDVLPPGVRIPKKVVTPVKVEPKFGIKLSTFSLALLNTSDAVGKIIGVLYTLTALY
ncbi:hypothetical protein [Parasitella parasitica]|uniref:Uncharacterized protein n=1 Tax=Parasitella parasitica TaxID=35722 RepID=A0A0B7NS86_9FUNG|nr:hypothetical protein [Parasitella parasitica]